MRKNSANCFYHSFKKNAAKTNSTTHRPTPARCRRYRARTLPCSRFFLAKLREVSSIARFDEDTHPSLLDPWLRFKRPNIRFHGKGWFICQQYYSREAKVFAPEESSKKMFLVIFKYIILTFTWALQFPGT